MANEPTVITIPKGSEALPDGMGQMKVGDEITIKATIQAIDDNGLTAEAVSVEAAPEAETPTEDAAGGDEEVAGEEVADNPQANYVAGRRKKMMASTE